MALIDQWGNRTIVRRLERQRAREAWLSELHDTPPNRQQRRALRKAEIVASPTKRQVKKEHEGREDELARRKVAFFGPKYVFGRKDAFHLVFGRGARSAWSFQSLSPKAAHRFKKALRKARRRSA